MNNILTERELEVLKLVLEGKTNKEIANVLYVSYHTVKAHISSIMHKIGCTSRVSLAVKTLRSGYVDVDNLRN